MTDLPERLLTPDLLLRPATAAERSRCPPAAGGLDPLRIIDVRSSGKTAGFIGSTGNRLVIELDPGHRRRGRGSEVLSAWLHAATADDARVSLEAQDDTARAFLRKFGFKQHGPHWISTARTRARLKDMIEAQDRRYRQRVHTSLLELGIPGDFGAATGLPLVFEARSLDGIGRDIFDRPQFLDPRAAAAWRQMVAAAEADELQIQPVSAFRGFNYQIGIVRRKMSRGESIEHILGVSAAPGYSQHHSGLAIDVTTPGTEPLGEAFEDSDAFRWLTRRAGEFGFRMSYPRHNPFGLAYEPWHWQYHGEVA